MASGKEFQVMFKLNASVNAGYQMAFSSAQKAIVDLQNKLHAMNKAQGDISAYQKQQQALEQTKAKLEQLKQEHDALQKELNESGQASEGLKERLARNAAETEKAKSAMDRYEGKLDTLGGSLKQAGVNVHDLDNESVRLAGDISRLKGEQDRAANAAADLARREGEEAMRAREAAQAEQEHGQALGKALEAMASAEIIGQIQQGLDGMFQQLQQCAQAAIEFESAMAAVKRTTGGSDSYIDELGDEFKRLSTEIPITSNELAGIAASAGQLGIAQENIQQFTTTMAQLATTTDLSADQASTMLAQFANITGTTQYDRLGATVAKLGDSTATTASKVVEMSQGMAAAASMAGMSETDILAIAAAVGSLGIEAQAGSTAMSTLISQIYSSVERGGDELQEFASIAGMTSAQFGAAWRKDAVGALNAFIQGLNDTERNGKSAVVLLNDLGINNVRQTKAILGLASAGDLLTGTIQQANAAWSENTALAEKAGIMYNTTEAKMTMAQNALTNIQVAIGDALTPTIGQLAESVTPVIQSVAEWIQANPRLVKSITAAAGAIGAVIAAVGALATAAKVAGAAMAIFGTAAAPILAVAAGLGVVAAVAVNVIDAVQDTHKSMEELDAEFDDLISKMEEQRQVLDMIDTYRDLSLELGHTSEAIDLLTGVNRTVNVSTNVKGATYDASKTTVTGTATATVEVSAKQVQDLTAAGFMKNGETTVELTGEQVNTLYAKDYFGGDEGLKVKLTAEQKAALTAAGFMIDDDTTVTLTPAMKETLAAADCLDSTEVVLDPETGELLEAEDMLKGPQTITLDAEATQTLLAEGFLAEGEDGTITLSAEADRQKLLDTAGFLVDRSSLVSLDGQVGGTVKAEQFVEGDTTIGFEGNVTGAVDTSDFVTGDTTVGLTGEVDTTLNTSEFIAGDTTVGFTGSAENSLPPTDFISGKLVELTAQADTEMVPIDPVAFMSGTSIDLTGEVGADEKGVAALLTPDQFVNGDSVMVFGEIDPDASLIDPLRFLTDPKVGLLGFVNNGSDGADPLLNPEAFLLNNMVDIYGNPITTSADGAPLTAMDLISGDGSIGISGIPLLTDEQGNTITADDFLTGGSTIGLSGEIATDDTGNASSLAPEDFVSGDTVSISAEGPAAADKLGTNDFVKTGLKATITAEVSAADAQEKLNKLAASALAAKSDLSAAETTLTNMQAEYDTLEKKLMASDARDGKDKKRKTELQSQLDDLSASISAQQTEVDNLEATYQDLNAEYQTARAEADALKVKEAQLAEVKRQLIESSGGIITATDEESEAFRRQLAVYETITNMKYTEYRQQALDAIKKQSQAYIQAQHDEEKATASMKAANEKAAKSEEYVADGVQAANERLQKSYDDIFDTMSQGYEWDSAETQGALKTFQELYNDLTDSSMDFGAGAAALDGVLDDVVISAEKAEKYVIDAHNEAADYAQQVADAQETQRTYIDNLVTGMEIGGISTAEMTDLLREQYAEYENCDEIVAAIMAEIQSRMDETASSAEDMGDAITDSLDIEGALSPALSRLAELNKAYTEAYDSAIKTADGIFKTFEKAGEIKISSQYVNNDDESMRASLNSQAEYLEEYTAMLQKAKELGVDSGILTQLTDGSMESAEYLKRLTADSTTAEDIEALNAAYANAEAQKTEFATTVADIQTDFTDTMTEIQTELTDAISDMEMSDEASNSAQLTIQAYIDQAEAMLPQVTAAFKALADAAQRELSVNLLGGSEGSGSSSGSGKTLPLKNGAIRGYAVGTQSAESGYAIVGENGPELVHFGGGEEVYTAEATRNAVLDFEEAKPMRADMNFTQDTGRKYELTLAPVYNISGNANTTEIEAILRAHDEELREQFESMLQDVEYERERRAYA